MTASPTDHAATALPDDLLVGPEWRQRLAEAAARHGVPGVQVGLLSGTGVRTSATGVTSASTEVPVDDRTLFQYGSIGKLWTATLVMQLVDEGLLALDTPVVDVLPGFRVADPDHGPAITVRHLLTHTSGIDGDVFTDTGDGDDCVEEYVAALADAGSTTRPGGPLSYCNSGFVVAGRIVEVLRGSCWDDALATHLLRPLGLDHVITRAKDAPLFRTAVGHLAGGEPTKQWMLPRSMGPAGLVTGSADALLRFAAMHLRDGVGLDGTRVLSAESARLMRAEHVSLAGLSTVGTGWGLGWSLTSWAGEPCAEHGGRTIGQVARLHTFPRLGLAMCVLTNASAGAGLVEELAALIGAELGLTAPEPHVDPDPDIADMVGVYESRMARLTLSRDADGRYHLDVVRDGVPDPRVEVRPTGRGRFVVEMDGAHNEFCRVEYDGVGHLHMHRLFRRVT